MNNGQFQPIMPNLSVIPNLNIVQNQTQVHTPNLLEQKPNQLYQGSQDRNQDQIWQDQIATIAKIIESLRQGKSPPPLPISFLGLGLPPLPSTNHSIQMNPPSTNQAITSNPLSIPSTSCQHMVFNQATMLIPNQNMVSQGPITSVIPTIPITSIIPTTTLTPITSQPLTSMIASSVSQTLVTTSNMIPNPPPPPTSTTSSQYNTELQDTFQRGSTYLGKDHC